LTYKNYQTIRALLDISRVKPAGGTAAPLGNNGKYALNKGVKRIADTIKTGKVMRKSLPERSI
jgi:hypothetical protein